MIKGVIVFGVLLVGSLLLNAAQWITIRGKDQDLATARTSLAAYEVSVKSLAVGHAVGAEARAKTTEREQAREQALRDVKNDVDLSDDDFFERLGRLLDKAAEPDLATRPGMAGRLHSPPR